MIFGPNPHRPHGMTHWKVLSYTSPPCVYVFSAGPLKVARSACLCAHAQYVTAHLRCANQGVVRILLLPGVNAPNVHKCTVVTEKNMMTFMTWQGQRSNPRGSRGQTKRARYSVPYLTQRSKVKPWGKSWGQTKHDRHSVPYLAQRSKVQRCARTCPALTTHVEVRA